MAVPAAQLAPRHPSPPAREPRLRLVAPPRRPGLPRAVYRRRRLAVLALLVLTGIGLWAALGLVPAPSHLDLPAVEPVVISAGDTIWGIAGERRPDDLELRVYVAEILAHNGLDARALRPGTVLRLP